MSTPLRQRMTEDMKIRNRSESTIKTYIRHVRRFAEFFGKSPQLLGPDEVRTYQVHLVEEEKVSWSNFNQVVSALRFLYGVTLARDWAVSRIPFAKKPKTLPTVLGEQEVQKLLTCTPTLKHRVILSTVYAAGLRLGEALHLIPRDIDSARMVLLVGRGKGAKQRSVPLSPRLLEALRDYWREYRPSPPWLFPGRNPAKPLSKSAVQRRCKRSAEEANIPKVVTPHTLRHSYATGLLEAGVDLLTISRLLGHRCFSTTLIYLHVRRSHLESVPSPLDWLPVDQCQKSIPADRRRTRRTPATATRSTSQPPTESSPNNTPSSWQTGSPNGPSKEVSSQEACSPKNASTTLSSNKASSKKGTWKHSSCRRRRKSATTKKAARPKSRPNKRRD